MRSKFEFKMKYLAQLMLSGALIGAAGVSFAQDVIDVGTVQNSAATYQQAPTQGSLVATQPQSIINQNYIQQNASAGSNYSDIVTIAPAVQSVNPNGPGLMETQSMTMRGFGDGQYNVTFDGIPWGDSNDFTHHSTSYMMPQDIGGIVVDRGPGDASNIGDATFGGTIAVQSKNPTAEAGFTPYATFGSFNTRLAGGEFNTGTMKNYGDASMFIDYKKLSSDGFLTNSGLNRGNLFVKYMKPVSADTVLTFVTMTGNLHQYVPAAISNADRAAFGYNFGLNNDPNSMSYYGYNYDNISTDMEYLDLASQQGDWAVDNKLYTYGYYHYGANGDSPGDPTATSGTGFNAADVFGQKMYMLYRSWGDILKGSLPMASGKLDAGVWVDRQTNDRMEKNVDWTLDGALDTTAGVNGYNRLMHDTLTTIQPYVQYEWKASDALTVTPGLKYSSFTRTIDAQINQKTGLPYSGSDTWSKALPALVAHYAISPKWSAYAQAAQGFLAPNLKAYYKTNPDMSTFKPTETTNFQAGTTWQDQKFTASADAYSIQSKNWMQAKTVGTQQVYVDAGDVNFSGAEAEGTVAVGGGFNLYGNYAIINYDVKDPASLGSAVSGIGGCGPNGDKLCDVPDNTYALGVLFNQGHANASLIAKEVGKRFSDAVQMDAYTITNFSVGYTIANAGSSVKNLKLGFQVNNLFNKNGPYMSTGSTSTGQAYFVIPERNYELSLSATL
jgi:iron complex outermembrane receptor protein